MYCSADVHFYIAFYLLALRDAFSKVLLLNPKNLNCINKWLSFVPLLNLFTLKNRSSFLHNCGLVVIAFITVHIVKNEPFEPFYRFD